jgi:hypothetical protein
MRSSIDRLLTFAYAVVSRGNGEAKDGKCSVRASHSTASIILCPGQSGAVNAVLQVVRPAKMDGVDRVEEDDDEV